MDEREEKKKRSRNSEQVTLEAANIPLGLYTEKIMQIYALKCCDWKCCLEYELSKKTRLTLQDLDTHVKWTIIKSQVWAGTDYWIDSTGELVDNRDG